jgi:lipopolysaccharide/colanic/teichoic acid biosynthesis glycosyltransferase
LGRFLRKSKLDELPQFVNVLRGTMSVVGPRPEQPHLVDALRGQIPFYEERHLVKPGITGWAQLHVYAGSVEETKLKLQYDLYYIKHRSFLFDLEILLKTVYFIFTWSGR